MFIGALQFMSPEQCQPESKRTLDGRSDRCGPAVTGYQVLTGWRYPAVDDTAVVCAAKFEDSVGEPSPIITSSDGDPEDEVAAGQQPPRHHGPGPDADGKSVSARASRSGTRRGDDLLDGEEPFAVLSMKRSGGLDYTPMVR